MRKSAMTRDALPHRGTAAPFRVGIGLALAASACVMLWALAPTASPRASLAPTPPEKLP